VNHRITNHPITNHPITVVSGGVGAARFLRGLIDAVDDPAMITAVVNTGDDCSLHGLSISPDLDTITYTLAGAIDPDRGWGLVDESWRSMEALARYEPVRPDGSTAAPRWFNLGDQDLATHFYRTARLIEGASLTEVSDEIRRAWQVPINLVPMSDQRLATMVTILDNSADEPVECEVTFQDYFVRLHHGVPVTAVRFDGRADLSPEARTSLADAETVVIAPSNPLVSIGPIRALQGVDDLLASRRDSVVAVSPIVGGAALKGPADRMMTELGYEASVVGVAQLYAPIASALVVDPVDEHLTAQVEATGMRCVVTPSIMSTPAIARSLALATLSAVQSG
jgi:LPPG:FO 2-phospho-L-lactate transferase